MSRTEDVQFNIRSAFARARAHDLARQSGMTVTEIVEDALRAYVPPALAHQAGGLVRRGPILVLPAQGRRITQVEADAALADIRAPDAED
jgi:hypothetical protein